MSMSLSSTLLAIAIIHLPLSSFPIPRAQSESQPEVSWWVLVPSELSRDAAIEVALEDLKAAGRKAGLDIRSASSSQVPVNRIALLDRDPAGLSLDTAAIQAIEPPSHSLGFRMATQVDSDEVCRVGLSSASVPGLVNALYWLWDRLRVTHSIPLMTATQEPVGTVRLTGAESPGDLRNALRYGATWVSGGNTLDLVPWNSEPEATRNRANRETLEELIQAAHAYHLKYLAVGDEFAYHPSFLEETGATLDPNDPLFWKAIQEKFRRLLIALPDLDGVQVRTGELTRVYGDYRPFDVMHGAPESGWPLEKRYRTFVRKVHEVVVGEFDKIYFQRTWDTSAGEQHANPEVYQAIFTEEVPTKSLFLSPYMSLADRWYYQPINPTFNLTPHKMLCLFSTLDYHAQRGANVFPSFPGGYFQEGLESILSASNTNLEGAHFGATNPEEWSTQALTAYTVYRLMWEPRTSLAAIAQDFAAIHAGREAAPELGKIVLLSQEAYKDGIYIKPVAEKIRGNTLPHLRLTSFKRRGIPEVDKGRGHLDWLRKTMYEPSLGQTREALELLHRGLGAAQEMRDRYRNVRDLVEDPELAQQIGDSIELTHGLVSTNEAYVRTCYAFFDFWDRPYPDTRETLLEALQSLSEAKTAFLGAPGFCYDLAGVEQLETNATEALVDLDRAKRRLAQAPDESSLDTALANWAAKNAEGLEAHRGQARKFFHWRGRVDGRDVVTVQGGKADIRHLEADAIQDASSTFYEPLPDRPVTVFVKDLESPEADPFLLEQPSEANGWSARVYLFDRLPSYCWWDFELYYLDADPRKMGQMPPWQ